MWKVTGFLFDSPTTMPQWRAQILMNDVISTTNYLADWNRKWARKLGYTHWYVRLYLLHIIQNSWHPLCRLSHSVIRVHLPSAAMYAHATHCVSKNNTLHTMHIPQKLWPIRHFQVSSQSQQWLKKKFCKLDNVATRLCNTLSCRWTGNATLLCSSKFYNHRYNGKCTQKCLTVLLLYSTRAPQYSIWLSNTSVKACL